MPSPGWFRARPVVWWMLAGLVAIGLSGCAHGDTAADTPAALDSPAMAVAHAAQQARLRHAAAPVSAAVPARPRPPAAPTRHRAAITTTAKVAEHSNPLADPALAHMPGLLGPGASGSEVTTLQQRLLALGYWVEGASGYFDDSTLQAVWAYQKAANLNPDGIVGPKTWAALAVGVVPRPRTHSGYVIEVDLADDLLLVVDNGHLEHVLNTSTGGGYYYSDASGTYLAETPTGIFHIYAAIDGMVTDSLGQLYRPRYFTGGFAIHGEGYVPAFPVSHGCVRVSDEAIDWIWADNIAPIGTTVDIYA